MRRTRFSIVFLPLFTGVFLITIAVECWADDTARLEGTSGRVLSGIVLDASSGEPIANAEVTAVWSGPPQNQLQRVEVGTGSDGRFQIEDIPADRPFDLSVIAAGYVGDSRRRLEPGTDNVEIRLTPGGTIRGTIHWETEPSRIGGWVSADPVERGPGATGASSGSWEDRFEFTGLRPNTYILRWRGEPDVERDRIEVTVRSGEVVEGIEMVLVEGGVLQVTVRDHETGQPVKGVPVQVISDAMDRPVGGETDKEGRVVAGGLRTGAYGIQTYGKKSRLGILLTEDKTPVDVRAGQHFQTELAYQTPVTLHGEVVSVSGAPIAGTSVLVTQTRRGKERLGGENLAIEAVTAADGSFELHDVPVSSTSTVRVVADGYVPMMRENVFSWIDGLRLVMPEAGEITGRVTDEDGRPVPAVAVKARPRPGESRIRIDSRYPRNEAVTTSDGTYRIGGLASGACTVSVEAATGSALPKENIAVTAGSSATGIDFVLRSGFSIKGHVMEEGTDRGVSGIAVTARSEESTFTATSEEGGQFEIRHVLPGTYQLLVSEQTVKDTVYQRAGYPGSPRERIRVADTAVEDVTVEVVRAATVEGRIVDAKGRPVAGFTVGYRKERGTFMGGTRTKDDGKFRIDRVSPGDVTLLFELQDPPMTVTRDMTLASGETLTGLTVTFGEGGSIAGTVTDAEGNPVSGASIVLTPIEESWSPGGRSYVTTRGKTADDGSFQLKEIPPGKYRILPSIEVAGHPTHGHERIEYVDSDSALTGIGMKLEVPEIEEAFIRGVVVNERGEPVPRCSVRKILYHESSPRPSGFSAGTTWHDGRFTFDEISAGTHELSVHPPLPYAPLYHIVVNAPTEEVRIVVRQEDPARDLASVSGTVVHVETGEPVERFRASITQYRGFAGPEAGDIPDYQYLERDGRFRIDGVRPRETVAVRIDAPGYLAEVSERLDPEPGEVITGLEFHLKRPAALTGTVLCARDQIPVPDAQISGWNIPEDRPWVAPFGSGSDRSDIAATDREGHFMLDRLGSGWAKVRVSHPDYATEVLTIAGLSPDATKSVEILLYEGGTVEGSVIDHTGSALHQIEVRLGPYPWDLADYGQERSFSDLTDSEGRFRVEHVHPGGYLVYVRVSHSGLWTDDTVRFVEMPEGETVNVEFALRSGSIQGNVMIDGEPAGGYTVRAESLEGEEFAYSTASHSSGKFDMKRVPVGDLVLRVYPPLGYRVPCHELPVTVIAGETLDVALDVPMHSITGTITSATTGKGIRDAELILVRIGDEVGDSGQTRKGTTDENGHFPFDAVLPGRYQLQARAEGHGHAVRPVEVGETGTTEITEITLGPAGGLRIHALPDEGTPDPSRMWHVGIVQGVGEDGFPLEFEFPRVREGLGDIRGLAPGIYTVLIGSPGERVFFQEDVEVRAGKTTDVRFDVSAKTPRFRVIIQGEDGTPVQTVETLLLTHSRTPLTGVPPFHGKAYLGNLAGELPRGIYRLHVEKPGYKMIDMPLDLRDVPGTYEMTVRLEKK